MIKVRSLNELTDVLANELAPRKQELTTFKLRMSAARNHEKSLFLRAGFLMIYAHFEGFIRAASTAYVSYVAHQCLPFAKLQRNFVAIGIKSQIQELGEVSKATIVTSTIDCLLTRIDETAPFKWSGEIDARSNLNRDVLLEIFVLTGLDVSWYQTKWAFVDEILLANRNNIAHGRMTQIDEKEYVLTHEQVIELLERFRTDIENAASTNRFMRSIRTLM